MLNKKYRLPAQIRLKNPSSQSFKDFVLKSADNSFSYSRFAFVISKNVDRKAVLRNKIKREMSAAASALLDKTSGKDFIFILKRSAVEDFKNLRRSVEEAII